MVQHRSAELTESQLYVLTMLSEQRGAHIIQLADLIGDMNSEGLEFLRRLGDPRYASLTKFLGQAEPATLNFLAEAREAEIEQLKDGLRLVVSFKTVGKVLKACVIFLFGAFVGVALIWDKIAAWLKPAGK